MGMFDTITCEYPLPDAEHQDFEFQTKDLERHLDHYVITRTGRLIRRARRHSRSSGPVRDVPWPLHGDLRFYTSIEEGETHRWVEYVARFTHGRVKSIQVCERKDGKVRETPPARAAESSEEAAEGAGDATTPVRSAEAVLLANLRSRAADLDALLESSSDHWGFEDPIYRFYHQSLEVYDLQAQTREMVRVLEALAPGRTLHPGFLEIIEEGTGREFEPGHNADWARITRPIVEAFFHARYFLEMAVRYAHLEEPPSPLPSGYAALLELYGLR